jgi:hypothetical protein
MENEMLNSYPVFDTLDEADDHVQFNCKGPVLCVVNGELWDVRGGGYAFPADADDVAAWRLHKPANVQVEARDSRAAAGPSHSNR